MQSLMMTLSRTIVFSMITFLGSMTLAGMEPLKPNSQTLLVIAQESKSDGSLKPVICQHNFDVRPDRLTITDDFKLNIPEKNAPSSKKTAVTFLEQFCQAHIQLGRIGYDHLIFTLKSVNGDTKN